MREKFRIGSYFLDKRPNSPTWCACWYEPKSRQTRRASLRTADFQEAQIALAEFVTKNLALKDALPNEVLLETVLIRYYDQHARHIKSEEQARFALAKWSDFFNGNAVADLTAQRIDEFIEMLQQKDHKPSYISRILSVGRSALNWAHKRGELTSVPFIKDVRRDADAEGERFRLLAPEEVARLLAAAAGTPHLLRFCMISLNTLARPDAILDLGPDQVDLDRRIIRLNPKGRQQTKKYRPVVPISNTLLPWLQECEGPRYVTYHGKPVGSIKKAFAKAAAEARVADVSPYCFRTSMATELRSRNVSEWEVAGFLGHKSHTARTTERYAAFRPDLPRRRHQGHRWLFHGPER